MTSDTLRIALQKSGRLKQDSINYINQNFDMDIPFATGDLYKDKDKNIEFVFLREKDILNFVMNGVVDMGIIGENTFQEAGYSAYPYQRLGFSECRMSMALPENTTYTGPNDLEGKTIATSYPGMLSKYLNIYNVEATIRTMSGSVEVAPSIGYADAVFDLVETGGTLKRNGLKEVATLFQSQAIAIFQPAFGQIEKEEMNFDMLLEIKRALKQPAFETPPLCRLARTY